MTHGGKRPGAGRPPRADVAATEKITLYFTPAELAEVTRASSGRVNAWAVPIVVRAARRQNSRG